MLISVLGFYMALIKKWSLRLLLLLVFVVVLLLATDNSQLVALSFLGYQSPEAALSWWVIGAFVLGAVFSMSLNLVTTTRLKLQVRNVRHSAEQSLVALDKANAASVLPACEANSLVSVSTGTDQVLTVNR
ncbi:MAG: putative membrane protein [Candidatus Azotimanducaceae bacterium]